MLEAAPDGKEAKEVIKGVEECLAISPFEDADYPNRLGVRRFPKIVRFTTISSVKAGWLTKQEGIWSLTDEGAAALKQYSEPGELMRESVRLYQQWRQQQEPSDDGQFGTDEEPVPSLAFEEAEETALSEIREHLQSLDPYDFQDLVAALLRAMSYHVMWVAPRGADGGLDILAQSDPLGTKGPRIKGQVKRRKDKATADDIRSFISLLGQHDVGAFISLGGFTPEAQSISRTQETRRLTLLGLSDLLELWVEHQSKIEETDRQLLPLTPVQFLTPSE